MRSIHGRHEARGPGTQASRYAALRVLAAVLVMLCLRAGGGAQDLAFMAQAAWSTEEGLPQASVHSIFQAQDGYLWVATEGGAARFDGVAWKSYTHETTPAFTSDDVSSIAEAPVGVLWFGTSDGLVRMAGTSVRRLAGADGLPSSAILSLAATGGDGLLVVTAAGAVHVDGGGVHAVPGAPGGATAAATGPNGASWLRTAGGITVSAGGATRTIALPRGSRPQTLLVDRSGAAWIGTSRGLFTLSPASVKAKRVDALGAESILSLLEDREGNFWIGTENSGVHTLRPRKFRAETATLGEGVTAVAQASDGVTWIGTRDDGVGMLKPDGTEARLTTSALTSPVILSLAPGTHGDVWAGTPDGLNHADGGAVHTYTSADGLPDDFVRSVLVGLDGSVWIGTRHGLGHLQGAKITNVTGLASESIGPLLETNASELWVGTAAGLARVKDGRVENVLPGPGVGSIVTALAQGADGALWVAVHGGGLSRFADGRFQTVGMAGVPQEISALAADANGYLWMRGKRGLYRASVRELKACAQAGRACTAALDRYGVPDGLPSDETAAEGSPSMWENAAGTLWIATRKGLAVADGAHLPVNRLPPPVALQRFAVDDAEQLLTGDSLRIGSGHRSFTFDYAALSYTMPSRVRYRYKLEGFDRDWIDAGSRRTAYYTSLPARRYRFRVIAANNDGYWNEAGAEVRFSVLPPFYLRWWFYALLLLLLFAVVAVAFQLRLRRVRGEFALVLNERSRVAREIHDTLAQDFVSVSLQLELVSQLVRGGRLPQATEQIRETRALVKRGLEAARQSIWDLRANAAQNALPVRLRKAVEAFGQRHPHAQVKVGGAYREVAQATENEVLRIAEESLSNIDRHAEATAVQVELRYDPEQLTLTVRDDGRGFLTAEALRTGGHYGLRGMQERALGLGGRLTIASIPGEGTTVMLTVPLGHGEGS